MSRENCADREPDNVDLEAVFTQLTELEEMITIPEQHRELRETRHLLESLPGGKFFDAQIDKYTTRDMGEAVVGSIVFSLPLLVEDGVFEIADHFVSFVVGGVPIFLLANVVFVVALATGVIRRKQRDRSLVERTQRPLDGFVGSAVNE